MESASRSYISDLKAFKETSSFSFKSSCNKFQAEGEVHRKAHFPISVCVFGTESIKKLWECNGYCLKHRGIMAANQESPYK